MKIIRLDNSLPLIVDLEQYELFNRFLNTEEIEIEDMSSIEINAAYTLLRNRILEVKVDDDGVPKAFRLNRPDNYHFSNNE